MKIEVANAMSVEELCDYAIHQLVNQRIRCIGPSTKALYSKEILCKYGDDEGRHCGVGWLLDEDNETLMKYEGSIDALASDYPDLVPDPIGYNIKLFELFQELHDEPNDEALRQLRLDHNVLVDNPEADEWVSISTP